MTETEYIEREAAIMAATFNTIGETDTHDETLLLTVRKGLGRIPTADVVAKAELESCKMRYEGMIGGMFAALIDRTKSEALRSGDMFANTQDAYYRGEMDAYRYVIRLLNFVKEKYTEGNNET